MFWGFIVTLTNTYLTYINYNLEAGVPLKNLIFHHDFLKVIAAHWIGDSASNVTKQ